MENALLVTSILIGLAVAAPIGPISLMCINRTLNAGRSSGLVFGAGIAAADGSYAALASFGLTGASSALTGAGDWLQLLGSLLLMFLGAMLVWGKPDTRLPARKRNPGIGTFASAYVLTLANPPTFLFFAGVVASLAAFSSGVQPVTFTAGVFAGSMLWWTALTVLVSRSARLFTAGVRAGINRASGLTLIGFAGYGLFSAFRGV